jgi:hypothetical protein
MLHDGVLEQIAQRLRVYRKGGYTSIDGVLFLLAYFCSGKTEGLKGFDKDVDPYRSQMAAVGGRKKLPTQSSMSRLLAAVDNNHLDEVSPWLLVEATGLDKVLNHPAMVVHDTEGSPWHLFDLDGTKTTFRRRSLPRDADLPEAHRDIDEELARPGYSGRKRSGLQMCRSTLEHLGSSAWLGLWLTPGHEDTTEVPALAAATVRETAHKAGIDSGRCILRCDGLYGGWTVEQVCRLVGIQYLVRWKSYQLLSDPKVLARLEESTWQPVASSLSGPRREAAELGTYTHPELELAKQAVGVPLGLPRLVDAGVEDGLDARSGPPRLDGQ